MGARTWRTAALLGAGVLATVALCGCGGKQQLDVAPVLAEQIDGAGVSADPGSLACGDRGAAEVGSVTECTFTTNGQPVRLMATVTSVIDDRVALTLATQAQPVPVEVLNRSIAVRAGEQLGAPISSAVCAAGLGASVGSATTCTLHAGSQSRVVEVAVTSIDQGVIAYSIKADR